MEEIEAIVKFDKLRNYLESIGIHVAEASADGYHAVKPGEVTLQAIKDGTYTFDEDGIYLNGSNGVRQKVYLYKRDYYITSYANSVPRSIVWFNTFRLLLCGFYSRYTVFQA